ncbi:MAG: S8 family serine peptidase [Methylococcaceae bacterium]|nr:S8 family serine peptidase [Methylococcaceae bacterium]
MNTRLTLSLIILLTISTPSVLYGADSETLSVSQMLSPANADHLLLVGFPDRTLNRVEISPASAMYRKRGSYDSSTWSRRISSEIAEDYHLIKVTEWPMTEVSVHCVVYQVPSDQQVPKTVLQLAKDSRVAIVQPMHTFSTQSASHDNDPYFKLQSNLQQMQINQAHGITTGKNISIAMIDTGVDLQHPDLAGQISKDENFAASFSSGFSTDKHGTAVAGVMVARKDNGVGITGIAPDAKLIAYKACWPNQTDSMEAVCNSYTLALAVNNAIKSKANILNMSLTGPQDPLLELLLNKAIEKGIIVVAANTKQPGEGGNFPASLQHVISVQSSQKAGSKLSIGDKEISAPGDKILTTLPHGTYDFISGSSISAAEISGIIALLMEIKPSLTTAEVQSILEKSQLLSKNDHFEGINANSAILALCETESCPESSLNLARKNTSGAIAPAL